MRPLPVGYWPWGLAHLPPLDNRSLLRSQEGGQHQPEDRGGAPAKIWLRSRPHRARLRANPGGPYVRRVANSGSAASNSAG